jgi:hypothetical protein
MTRDEMEAALYELGWQLDGPTRTAGGWKGTIARDDVTLVTGGDTEEGVLKGLLDAAKQYERNEQAAKSQERP